MSAASFPEFLDDNRAGKFRDRIEAQDFPCVGAKSALARDNLSLVSARNITSGWNDLEIHRALMEWSKKYSADKSGLRSLVVVFDSPLDLDEAAFEKALWKRLQSLSDKDDWLGQKMDSSVSGDPENPHFALSFGGQAYFVIGLHPNASRPARQFPQPAIVFNLHDQFEELRKMGVYQSMQKTITKRDIALAGSPNPMIATHGESSAARQYSGRKVSDDWKCPYSDPRS